MVLWAYGKIIHCTLETLYIRLWDHILENNTMQLCISYETIIQEIICGVRKVDALNYGKVMCCINTLKLFWLIFDQRKTS